MTDRDFAAPSAGAHDPNLPVGGKEPRSSMGPIIATRCWSRSAPPAASTGPRRASLETVTHDNGPRP
jgi:hypothetical protein